MDQQQATLTAVVMAAMKGFTNPELAEFNTAIQLDGNIPPANLAYEKAVEYSLVKPSGVPWDLAALRAASAAEVNRRVDAGEFE